MITKRENILRLLRGEKPAWTPCSLNFYQWFIHHQNFKMLPGELKDAKNYLHAMKILGCDLFSRNCDSGMRSTHDGVEIQIVKEPGVQGERTVTTHVTPYGNLRRIWEAQPVMTTGYDVEDFVKDWQQDKRAYLWNMERWQPVWDEGAFRETEAQVGDDGVVLLSCLCSPLKRLHIDFGLDGSCFLLADAPEDADEICKMYWQRVMPIMQKLAVNERVHAICLMDNVDTSFYPPAVAQRYWVPYVREAAELLHAHGKKLFVHACGQLHLLRQVFIDARIDGLEGMAHPPLGDWTTQDTLSMPDEFIYIGGFGAHEQVSKSDDEIRRHYEIFFRELRTRRGFVFSSSCQTAVTTPWERIKLVAQLCREFGGKPAC